MTPLTSSFRSQILLVVLALWLGCRSDDGLSGEGPGFGGSGGASGAGGTGGSGPSDAGSTFFVDRPPGLTPDIPVNPLPPDAAPARDTPPLPDAAPSPQPDAVSSLDRPPLPPPPPPPDAPPPPPPDTAPPPDPNAIVPTSCEEIPCQQLFLAAVDCNTDGQACQSQQTAQDPVARTNYCHASGIRKLSSTTFSGDRYMTTMRVNRANGSHCYTLEMSGSTSSDVETQVWKAPSGAVLMTGSWTRSVDRLLLSCNGLSYDTREIGCPGLDGEPSVLMCPAGACPD